MRDLSRARETAVMDLRAKRQQVSAFLLRQGRHYPESKKTWTKAHMDWLASQKLEYAEQRLVFEEMMLAIRQANDRLERLEQAIRVAVPGWSLAEVVTALMAMRGIDVIAAATFLAEIGDLSRFQTAAELMGYLGLVPVGDFDWRQRQARAHHQGGQPARPPHAGGVRLGLSAPATGGAREGAQGGRRAASGARDRLEGTVPATWALPSAGAPRQAQDRGHHSGGARARRFHLGGQPGDRQRPCCGQVSGLSEGSKEHVHRLFQGARTGAWSGEEQISCSGGSAATAGEIPVMP
jgi:hypothetical protein